jgi:hypothetical protein
MSGFYVGQKVVCISAFVYPHLSVPIVGQIYTIDRLTQGMNIPGITLVELPNGGKLGWWSYKFRPVVEKKTNTGMAILQEILTRETISDPVPVTIK